MRSIFSTMILLAACGPTFYERALEAPGATRLPSGGVVREVHPGDGASPRAGTWANVAWEGRYADGTVFTSAKDASLAVDQVSPCFRDALLRMKSGETVKLVCTDENGHGDQGPFVRGGTVEFDLTLLAVADAPESPLPAGLLYKTLRDGTGEHPRGNDRVKVEYQGRLDDGTVFDETTAGPVELSLANVITCWQDAVPKMRVGEKAEIVCPPDIAYGKNGSPPRIPPSATLTFDITLDGIVRE